jgi:hypothetical protein
VRAIDPLKKVWGSSASRWLARKTAPCSHQSSHVSNGGKPRCAAGLLALAMAYRRVRQGEGDVAGHPGVEARVRVSQHVVELEVVVGEHRHDDPRPGVARVRQRRPDLQERDERIVVQPLRPGRPRTRHDHNHRRRRQLPGIKQVVARARGALDGVRVRVGAQGIGQPADDLRVPMHRHHRHPPQVRREAWSKPHVAEQQHVAREGRGRGRAVPGGRLARRRRGLKVGARCKRMRGAVAQGWGWGRECGKGRGHVATHSLHVQGLSVDGGQG